uniref:Uncharacterized protein n=1 Tax=Oncorhynchus tshawytscha TaxID=74940 RepID=A0AAZ3NRL1_ONCTS
LAHCLFFLQSRAALHSVCYVDDWLSLRYSQNCSKRASLVRLQPAGIQPPLLLVCIPVGDDATSQYIEGREEVVEEGCLCPSGLQCALVLIGVYLRATGEPVIGVINQPFNHKDPTGWKGKHFWGVSCGSVKASSVLRPKERPAQCPGLSVVLSSSEKQVVKEV